MQQISPLTRFFLYLGLFGAVLSWGSTFFLVKGSVVLMNPVTLVAIRFWIAAVVLAVFLCLRRVALFSSSKEGFILGFFLWLLYVPQTIGLGYTSAANSGFITGLFVVFVPLLGWLMYKQIPSKIKMLSVSLSIVGLWILTGGIQNFNIGDGLTLVTAIAYAIHILLAESYVKNKINPIVLSFQQFLTVAVLSTLTCFFFHLPLIVLPATWPTLIFLAIVPTLLAFVMQLVAQRHISSIKVALIFVLEPVFAALFAWTLGGEIFHPLQAVGGGVIFVAMVLSEVNFTKFRTL